MTPRGTRVAEPKSYKCKNCPNMIKSYNDGSPRGLRIGYLCDECIDAKRLVHFERINNENKKSV